MIRVDLCQEAMRLVRLLVRNLLENAQRHGAGGPVEAGVEPLSEPRPAVRLWVDDHGPGVPEPDRERIFEAFHRASPDARGVGLGLHIAREIVKLHGGSLEVTDGEGGGAMFVLTLPRESRAVS